MMREYGKKDLKVGDILTTKNNRRYVVTLDEGGNWDVISLNGEKQKPFLANRFKFDEAGNIVVDRMVRDNGVVVKVERYDCEPGVNRLAAALASATGKESEYRLEVVWTSKKSNFDGLSDKLKQMQDNGASDEEIRSYLIKQL